MKFLDEVSQKLSDGEIAIVDSFFSKNDWAAIQKKYFDAWEAAKFRPATVGSQETHQTRPDVRSDLICWLETNEQQLDFLGTLLVQLRLEFNQRLYLGLRDQEFHFAYYHPGSFYQKHVDRFQKDDRRQLSLIVYLNEEWKPEWGGELRIHQPVATTILPLPNRAVFFLSDEVVHEVLPAQVPRKSLTGWFRRTGLMSH